MRQRMAGEAIAKARQERPEVFTRGRGRANGGERPAVVPQAGRPGAQERRERERPPAGGRRDQLPAGSPQRRGVRGSED